MTMPAVRDALGPEYVVRVYDPKLGMTGYLVIDNTALGPGKGGFRMTPSVTEEEIRRLARTMTLKNAAAGLPFGGAKGGIVWPGGPDELKKKFVQSFARALKPFAPSRYISAPDVNTGEREMQWFVEAVGDWRAATGKPANYCTMHSGREKQKCGIPHEVGSTGFGVAHATAVAAETTGLSLSGATVAIHGFGNVGTFTYRFLTEMGAKIVVIADKSGAVYSENGFDKDAVEDLIRERKEVTNAFPKSAIPPEKFWGIPVDILIPASVTDVINESNKESIRAKIIVEAGNIPMREEVEEELFGRGIAIVPDFIANAGGVISSYAEYRGYDVDRMFELVKDKITKAARAVLRQSAKEKRNPREVAIELAVSKVEKRNRERETTFE
jgi:glutamate dehydrogenase (NAD(P)+)